MQEAGKNEGALTLSRLHFIQDEGLKKNECSSVKLAKRVRIKMLQRGMRQLCIHNMLRLGPPTGERHDKAFLTAIPLGQLMIN